MTDLWYYQRVACCVLAAATEALEDAGLPVPARREYVQFGQLGNPVCCDALLVSRGPSRPNLLGRKGCAPVDRVTEWRVRIFRPVCQVEPECGATTVDCFEIPLCPGDPWNGGVPSDPCSPLGRAETQALLDADQAVLEHQLPKLIDRCMCDTGRFPNCDQGCGFGCSDPTSWLSTEAVSGGGCAGSIIKVETRTIRN